MTRTMKAEDEEPMPVPPLLEIENLSTHLGSDTAPVRAVDGVSLNIRRGETFVLLGESGCGKSMIALSIMRCCPLRTNSRRRRSVGRAVAACAVRSGNAGRARWSNRDDLPGPMTSLNPVMTVGEQVAEAVRLHDPAVTDR